jgi:hypothetical protein
MKRCYSPLILPGNAHGFPLTMPTGCPVCKVIAHFTLSLFCVLLLNLFYEISPKKLLALPLPDAQLPRRAQKCLPVECNDKN